MVQTGRIRFQKHNCPERMADAVKNVYPNHQDQILILLINPDIRFQIYIRILFKFREFSTICVELADKAP